METPRLRSYVAAAKIIVLMALAGGGLYYALTAPTQEPGPSQTVPKASVEPLAFPVDRLDAVMGKYVTADGLVDYAGLAKDTADLDTYLDEVKKTSPHSNTATFPSEDEALAYWINAYNAWMLRAVLDAYPIASVNEIKPGVFDAKGRICGGEDFSLNQIEHEIVRKEFLEPRAHFALNCASMGCPWIPQEAFDARRLDEQLDREARRFFMDPTHLFVDAETQTVDLSPILDWYGEDFTKWLTEEKRIREPNILQYVKLYAPEDLAAEIGEEFDVTWQDYVWKLNDKDAEWANLRPQME